MKKNSTSGIFTPRVLRRFLLCSIGVVLTMLSLAAPAAIPPLPTGGSFTAVGSMNSARSFHTATLLGSGKVLIAGGYTPAGVTNKAELFDPASGTFTALPPMTSARWYHTATMLPNGKVLIAGGLTSVNLNTTTNMAELFDPASGTFTSLPPMTSARSSHTATLLVNGKVLLAGGDTENGTTSTAELFDPTSGNFTALSSPMTSARSTHTATLLPTGKVLIAGGFARPAGGNPLGTNTAELFDPLSGGFTSLAPNTMTSIRYNHTATLLENGKILLAGGFAGSSGGGVTNTAELFDPASGTFTSLAPKTMTSPRWVQTATLLPNGKVLIAGGQTGLGGPATFSNTAELFDPASQTFTALAPMNSARSLHTAILLPNGTVLIAGGYTGLSGDTNTAEQFDSTSGTFTSLSPNTMTSRREHPSATVLPSGKVLIAGGHSAAGNTNTAELFDPATGTFTSLPPMASVRYYHTATLLPSGKVLMAGGYTAPGDPPTNTAELFDPASGTFTSLPLMTSARVLHTATLLPNGKVLLAGGTSATEYLNTADLFDPDSGTFTSLTALTGRPMNTPRFGHTATLLSNGMVLIAGGITTGFVVVNTAELFDPASGTFTALPNMNSKRDNPTATLLPNGKVLIAGGYTGTEYTNSAELFDPASQTFMLLPPMNSTRYVHSATLLPGGMVLLAGGVTQVGVSPTNTAELFDPVSETFTLIPNTMSSQRYGHLAILLPSGQILIAGGYAGGIAGYTNTAELFDAGLLFSNARRPVISTASTPLILPASLVLTGTGFRGDAEASGGGFQNSATNYPVVQLMRIDNEQTFFVRSDPAKSWSDTSFSSEPLGAVTSFPSGEYRVTVFTNGIPSLQKIVSVPASTTPVPVQVASVVSRKAHGNVEFFDVQLPVTGPPGIECRPGGANGRYTLLFNFVNTLINVGGASVTSGSGTVSTSAIGSDPHQYIVQLTGVTNAQVITVTLSDVSDSIGNSSATVSVPMGVLVGDTTGNGSVNSSDISQTKAQSGRAVTSANFRQDVNISNSINSSDISLVKSKSGTGLP